MYKTNDTLIEEMIRLRNGGRAGFVKVGVVILAVILILAVFIFYRPLFPVATAIFVVAAILGFKYTIIEYEYSFLRAGTEADLTIDKIMGQRKRSQLITIKCSMIRAFGSVEPGMRITHGKVLDASISPSSPNRWYIKTTVGDGGEVTVFFNPSERLCEALQQSLPRELRLRKK